MKIFKFIFTFSLLLFVTSLFAQKHDLEEIKKNIAKNENQKIIKQCTSIEGQPSVVFINTNTINDKKGEPIGTSWTFLVHNIQKINGKNYYKGHLISPRGGHQPEVVFIDPLYWNCFN